MSHHSSHPGHDHHHNAHGANKKILLLSFSIITGYMIIEAIGGYVTNSLALLSDAGHMLSDSISLGLALLAFMLSEKAASYSRTYGWKRLEILAAVINGITLIGIAIFIAYEAVERFRHPPEVATTGMLIISLIGLLVNITVAWMMLRGGDTKNNLNLHGAFLHVLSDMLGSVGAIGAAIVMMVFGWGWADPLASVIVALLVLRSGYNVTKKALHVLMEGTPEHIDVAKVIETLESEERVFSVHDLHIWTITSGWVALSCHLVVDAHLTLAKYNEMLHRIEHRLEHLGIGHMTIQIETEEHRHDNALLCAAKSEPAAHAHFH